MSDNFDACLAEILHHEGGWSDNPSDPGGQTNLGVTKRVWEQWTKHPCDEAVMRSLTPQLVGPLYRKNYWEASGADKLSAGIALCVFDFAVNAGPSRAAKMLQRVVSVEQDGKVGSGTLVAVFQYERAHTLAALVHIYQEARRDYYRSLPTFNVFGRGWLRRVDEVEAKAKAMA